MLARNPTPSRPIPVSLRSSPPAPWPPLSLFLFRSLSLYIFLTLPRRRGDERGSAQTDQKDIACRPIVSYASPPPSPVSCHFFPVIRISINLAGSRRFFYRGPTSEYARARVGTRRVTPFSRAPHKNPAALTGRKIVHASGLLFNYIRSIAHQRNIRNLKEGVFYRSERVACRAFITRRFVFFSFFLLSTPV